MDFFFWVFAPCFRGALSRLGRLRVEFSKSSSSLSLPSSPSSPRRARLLLVGGLLLVRGGYRRRSCACPVRARARGRDLVQLSFAGFFWLRPARVDGVQRGVFVLSACGLQRALRLRILT